MTSACSITGNPDLYGLGMRIGYYLQWYAILFASFACPKEVPILRHTNACFVSIVFFAVLTQLVRSQSLDDIDIYITMLFTFGSTLNNLILLLWRITTRFSVRWDPSRYRKAEPPGRLFSILNFLVLETVFGFEIWFWTTRLQAEEHDACERYGFLFGKVSLRNEGFRYANATLSVILLLTTTMFLISVSAPEKAAKILRVKDQQKDISQSLIKAYQLFNTFFHFVGATTIIAATELAVRWNNISGLNSVSSAGQFVPLMTGLASFARVTYVAVKEHTRSQTLQGAHEESTSLAQSVESPATELEIIPATVPPPSPVLPHDSTTPTSTSMIAQPLPIPPSQRSTSPIAISDESLNAPPSVLSHPSTTESPSDSGPSRTTQPETQSNSLIEQYGSQINHTQGQRTPSVVIENATGVVVSNCGVGWSGGNDNRSAWYAYPVGSSVVKDNSNQAASSAHAGQPAPPSTVASLPLSEQPSRARQSNSSRTTSSAHAGQQTHNSPYLPMENGHAIVGGGGGGGSGRRYGVRGSRSAWYANVDPAPSDANDWWDDRDYN